MNKVFSVLSDKYKPLKWNEVIGQKDIIFILKKAIQENRLSRILFFFGPKGIGKNTCARILSNELNSFSDSELRDFSLNRFEINGIFNNSLEYFYKIINESRFIPRVGKYNVFIINDVHMFSQCIFNSILRFIEEKHPHILFIFCGTEEKKIPKFILSYCQVYEFKSISTKEIFLHLKMIATKENIEIENEALLILSKYVKGSISKALYLFDKLILYSEKKISKEFLIKKLGIIDIEYYFKLVDYLLDKKIYKIFILLDKILQKKMKSYDFIIGLIKHFRNLFFSKNYETSYLLNFKKEILSSYIAQSKRISYYFLINALSICIRLKNEYEKFNKNSRLTIEIYLIQLSYLFDSYKNYFFLEEEKENVKIEFLQKNWIKFIHKFYGKINPIYLYFLKNEIQFRVKKNKIFFIIPDKLKNRGFLLIKTHFVKYFKEKLNNTHLEFEIVKKNSNAEIVKKNSNAEIVKENSNAEIVKENSNAEIVKENSNAEIVKENSNAEIVKENSSAIEQYHLLYKKNKLIETLIERLNLKISSSEIQE
ncbi:AAA family ATPase [Blattabacterium cuenoti]|uniref:AAA family ATPase n=1 Tax=Blattabacterium cuenoti TaxID=1653831 RepID=UPI00163D0E1C|nr:AAA family ATPase [Blattabacterium cuenoti]